MKLLARTSLPRNAVLVLVFALMLTACGSTTNPPTTNVRLYSFPAFVHNGNEQQFALTIPYSEIMESLVLAYVESASDFWYPLPGHVTSTHAYRVLYFESSPTITTLAMNRTEGSTDQSFFSLKVIVAPVTTIFPMAAGVDLSDYAAVKRHFALTD